MGIIFVCSGLFIGGIELYKWGKRVYFRRTEGDASKIVDEEQQVEGGEVAEEKQKRSSQQEDDPAPTTSTEKTVV